MFDRNITEMIRVFVLLLSFNSWTEYYIFHGLNYLHLHRLQRDY